MFILATKVLKTKGSRGVRGEYRKFVHDLLRLSLNLL